MGRDNHEGQLVVAENGQVKERHVYPMSRVDPRDTRTELACGAAKIVLMYYSKHYGQEALERLVAGTRMNLDYLRKRTNWISFDYYCRLLRELVRATGDDNAPYSAGLHSNKRECYGAAEFLVARMATVGAMYSMMVALAGRYSKIATWKMTEKGPGKCTLSVQLHGLKQDRNNCLSLQGIFAGVPALHGLPAARIRHSQCACDSGDVCVYELSWVDKPRNVFTVAGLGAGITAGFTLGSGMGPLAFGAFTGAGLFLGCAVDFYRELRRVHKVSDEQARYLDQSIQDNEAITKELQNTVEARTAELRDALAKLKKSQAKEIATARHTATGLLASAMAHQMNSPLNAISLSLQSLAEEMGNDPAYEGILGTAKRGSRRCRDILNQLLVFSREPERTSQARLDLIIPAALASFEKEQVGNTKVVADIPDDLPPIHLDRTQIQQVLINLLTNASDAMEGAGTATVTVERDGEDVVVSVADDGHGIDENAKEKLFQPLYSTKHNQPRLGIGLSIAARLAEHNGGVIDARNRPEHGSVFTLRFPIEGSGPEEARSRKVPLFANQGTSLVN